MSFGRRRRTSSPLSVTFVFSSSSLVSLGKAASAATPTLVIFAPHNASFSRSLNAANERMSLSVVGQSSKSMPMTCLSASYSTLPCNSSRRAFAKNFSSISLSSTMSLLSDIFSVSAGGGSTAGLGSSAAGAGTFAGVSVSRLAGVVDSFSSGLAGEEDSAEASACRVSAGVFFSGETGGLFSAGVQPPRQSNDKNAIQNNRPFIMMLTKIS